MSYHITLDTGEGVDYNYVLTVGGGRYTVYGTYDRKTREKIKDYLRSNFDPVSIKFSNEPPQ